MHRSKILLVVLLVTGLLLAACAPTVHQADPQTKELVIKTWAVDGQKTIMVSVTTADGEFIEESGFFTWYYDVPSDQAEFFLTGEPWRGGNIHLHRAKNPDSK